MAIRRKHKKGPGQLEDTFWLQVRRADEYEDYAAYLEKYPGSDYAPTVRRLMEQRLWERVRTIDLKASYRAYLEDYPNARFQQEATQALAAASN